MTLIRNKEKGKRRKEKIFSSGRSKIFVEGIKLRKAVCEIWINKEKSFFRTEEISPSK